jgi:hypothetical protein
MYLSVAVLNKTKYDEKWESFLCHSKFRKCILTNALMDENSKFNITISQTEDMVSVSSMLLLLVQHVIIFMAWKEKLFNSG